MKYKPFGNIGLKVSLLGFGCMRFPMIHINDNDIIDEDKVIQLLLRAYELGINYFDTAYFYCNGLSEVILGKALKYIRHKVYISTKCHSSYVQNPGDYRKILENQLKKLNMEYIDFYHFHGIRYQDFLEVDKRANWVKDAQNAKEEGLIRHISFSTHDKVENIVKLIDLGIFESMLCQYNIIDQRNENAIAYAKLKGIGIAIMGPLGGGRIFGLPKKLAEEMRLNVNNNIEMGLRFVLSNPNIDCILSGMENIEMLEENVSIFNNFNKLNEEDQKSIKRIIEEKEKLSQLYCTGCSYCIPCPVGIDIPFIFKLMNYYKIYGLIDYSKVQYNSIGNNIANKEVKADACIRCGKCETKCPQKIAIRKQLEECHLTLSLS